jgi:polyvinyl alcohol dehydrogenase (cytochrome)
MRTMFLVLSLALTVIGCTTQPEPVAQGGMGGAGGNGGTAASGAPSESVPCAVATVLEQHCTRCHGAPLRGGATVSLVRASDFALPRGAQSVGQAALARVPLATPQRMPPPPNAALSANEVAILSGWINGGALADPQGCAVQTAAPSMPVRDASEPLPPLDSSVIDPPDGGVLDELHGAWSMFGRDLSNSRANLDELAIGPSTVASLVPAWDAPGAACSATPAIVGGVVYLPSWDGSVVALRAQDGEQVWKAMLPSGIDSSPAVTRDRVFVTDTAGSLHALDRATGVVDWSVRVDPHPEAHLWSSPIVIESANLIVVGVASYEEVTTKDALTFRGSVVGLDLATGAERFKTFTTAGDADEGAGVAVWATASVDEARGLLYIGTGNNYVAPGSDLSDAMLAIDYASGDIVWSHQFLADDIFAITGASGPDHDIGSTANLFSAGGRDFVGVGIKSGVYAALDRDTGTPVWMANVSPGGIFGGIIAASAYANGLIYAAGNDPDAGETAVAAIDAASGAIVWDARLPQQSFGGLAYANGVVFMGTLSSTLTAFDALSGAVLWSETLTDVAASPAIANGMLFVAWGYPITLSSTDATSVGGLTAYRLP